MSNLQNIERAVAMASRYVQSTWQEVVMGATKIPSVPEIKVNVNLRKIYADSIVLGEQVNVPDAGSFRATIIALKEIARELEYGRGPWDMKPGLLNGPKARVSKNGTRYNIIPFRHATPGGTKNTAVGRSMPRDIYRQARALKASLEANGRTQWGGKLQGTEKKYRPGQNPTTGYQHKSGKYEGMVRVEKTYERATQSKYLTMRVVSTKSDPQSWWHPGYQAHHIVEGVRQFCKPQVEEMIKQAAYDDLLDLGTTSIGMSVTRT